MIDLNIIVTSGAAASSVLGFFLKIERKLFLALGFSSVSSFSAGSSSA